LPVQENADNWKMPLNIPNSPPPKTAIPEIIKGLAPIFGKQIEIQVRATNSFDSRTRAVADFLVRVSWQGQWFEFAAEAKGRNTPRVLEDALRQTRRWASESGRLPMVIVPFLGEKRIERLLDEGVSGLDLCGNGLVLVPGRMLLRRTGLPNRYPESRPARFAYRGATSQVPRAFLRRAEYSSVSQIKDEIESAGGSVVLSTVSKALARMADDLIIDRTADRIVLLQPDKLLDTLAENYILPRPERVEQAKTPLSLAALFGRVTQASEREGPCANSRLVLSGMSSQDRYSAGIRADTPMLYTDNLGEIRRRLEGVWQPTERFADLTLIETRDPTVFFDARSDDAGVLIASPVQAYLELNAGREKRDLEIAQQIRSRILRDIEC
jgi:hypothetical protein